MSTRTDAAPTLAPSRYELNGAHVAFTTLVFFVGFGANGLRNSLGFAGWGVVIAILAAIAVVWLVRSGKLVELRRAPLPLLAYGALLLLSTAWSHWRPETLLGWVLFVIPVLLALTFSTLVTWEELLVGFSGGLRWVIGLSLLFELFVSTVIRHPILPVFQNGHETWQTASLQLMWSRDLLFTTGKIQGIVGNSSILSAVAAVALIVVGLQIATRRMGKGWGTFWLVLIIGTLVGTRDATMTIALVVTAVVLVAVLIRRRVRSFRARIAYWFIVVIGVVAAAIVGSAFWGRILDLLGKDSTLTGRTTIWENTIGLAVQHPIVGWGWIGFWEPWVEPLGTLNVRYGVAQLHAHDAWIDLWMQVGIVGAVLFALLVLGTLVRSYRAAVTPIWKPSAGRRAYNNLTLLPLLILVLLIVQSITESRLLIEEGLTTLCLFAIKLKLDPFVRSSEFAAVENR